MRFVIAGASGFLGQAWMTLLGKQDHEVIRLVRRPAAAGDESQWDPATGTVDQDLIQSADFVVNLAGASSLHVPWTQGYARTFLASRVGTTRTLAEAVAKSERKPTFVAQSGVAGYGDHGSKVVTEDTPTDADTFMADVVRRWEAATEPASTAGARVVIMRTGVVLDRSGGAFKTMLPVFRLGLGGPVGSGQQHVATISLHDWLGAATYLALNDELEGPFNVSGPDTCTNMEFTEELGRQLHRPTVMRVPGPVLRRVAGPIGSEMLASTRAEPHRLLEAGYAFAHNDVSDRIAAALRGC